MDETILEENLLLAILAFQDELITRDQFHQICSEWAPESHQSLAQILTERKLLTDEQESELLRRVERRIARHGDVRKTLDATLSMCPITEVLSDVKSPLLRSTLSHWHGPLGRVLSESVDVGSHSATRYTLTRLHGEGGLGKVWVARDCNLNRDVALKEVKAERSEDESTVRRFLREAQITGQLEHPNIVPVYELGRRSEDGHPYYTMRLVRGRTLRKAIQEYHQNRRARQSIDPIEFQRLLNIFVSICHALGYAHSRGVIHRDLKPDNIVLGDFGEVIVLDWGLAKYIGSVDEKPEDTGPSAVTLSDESTADITVGQLGTPAYMAPEQAEARNDLIDHLTDIYGLGAILYEILTGSPPVTGETLSEVFSTLIYRDIPGPRSLEPSVPAALDAVCCKAMARRKEFRYPRADDLADEISRWIAGEPVHAYRDPIPVRMARWGRRHKSVVVGGLVMLIASVIGLSVHNVIIARLRDIAVASEMEAKEQRSVAQEHQKLAELNFSRARDAVEQMLTEVGTVDLVDIPQMESVRGRLLEKAQRFYLEFLEQRRTDTSVQSDVARGHWRLGDIEELLGDYEGSEKSYRKSIAMLKAATPSREAEIVRARALQGLGILLRKSNRFREAESTFREALDILERLVSGDQASGDEVQALAQTRYHLGALLAKIGGQGQKDEEAYREAVRVQEVLIVEARDRPEQRRELARYLNNLGILLRDRSRFMEAEQAFHEAQAIMEGLGSTSTHASPGDLWQLAQIFNNMSVLLKETSRRSDAKVACQKARGIQADLVVEFPHVPVYRSGLAATLNNLALLLRGENARDEADRSIQQALELLEKLVAEVPGVPDYRYKQASTKLNQGTLLAVEAPLRADRAFRDALRDFEEIASKYPSVPEYQFALGNALFCLGDLQARQGHFRQARQYIEDAIIQQRKAIEANPRNLNYLNAICLCYQDYFEILAHDSAHREIARRADELIDTAPDLPNAYLIVASNLAQNVSVASRDTSLSETTRTRAQQEYADRAVSILRRAFEKRLILDPRELRHPSLEPIRQRKDFQKLIKEMEDSYRPVRVNT